MAQKNVIDIDLDDTSREFVLILNGVAMETLDTANKSNGHWKLLVTVIFLSQL
jgi:hypothetical protein